MKLSHLSLAVFSAIALAACGGSGDDQTTIKKDPPKEVPGGKDDTTPSVTLSPDAVATMNAQGTLGQNRAYAPTSTVTLPNQYLSSNSTIINSPATNANGADLRTLAGNQAYIPNPDLVDGANGNLLPDTFTVGTSNTVFYKTANGTYLAAVAAAADGTTVPKGGIAGKKYYFPQAAGGTAKLDSAPLKASDLYQVANWTVDPATAPTAAAVRNSLGYASPSSFTDVAGFELLDQTLPNPTRALGKVDRTKIKQGEIVTSDVKAVVNYTTAKLAPTNAGGANQGIQVNSDKEAINLTKTEKFKVGTVKAYNLPNSLTTLTINANDAVAGNNGYFNTFYSVGNGRAQVAGLRTLELPQNAKATYTGKVFGKASEADLSLDVEFGVTNSAYVKNVKITNRKDSTSLEDLVSLAPAAVNYTQGANSNNDYVVDLIAADGTNPPANPEYQSLGGKFYGPNAEETAGAMYSQPQQGGAVVGAYAAQRGSLSK